ncbi:MAG: hypothetical protein L3J89_07820 [Gammaproteobacteria bacterium]|nr:hypothetical protein [Gammaproteobacteria bacterium]
MPTHLIAPLLLLLTLTGCGSADHDNHKAGAHNHGDGMEHDHSGDDEHVDRSSHVVNFNENNELFLQYETLVAKRDAVFLVHITDLTHYTPIPGGFITIILSGGGVPDEIFSGKRPVRDGIHIEVALPQYAGERQLSLRFETDTTQITHDLGKIIVYPDYASSKNSAARLIPENAIYIEKEAQWKTGLIIQAPTIDKQQLTLPASAIHQNNNEKLIYVMSGAEFFEPRKVTTGEAHHGRVTILSGVTADEYVVIKEGRAQLSDDRSTPLEMPGHNDDLSAHDH